MAQPPFGFWRPQGSAPLTIDFAMGNTAALWIGRSMAVVGLWALIWFAVLIHVVVGGPASGKIAVSIFGSLVGVILGGFGVVIAITMTAARRARVIVGPAGIVLQPGDIRFGWNELAQVGVCVQLPWRAVGGPTATTIQIGMRPVVADFGGRKLPDLKGLNPPEPFTHGIVVPSPGPLSSGHNIPIVGDLDAALRYFAGERYTGVGES